MNKKMIFVVGVCFMLFATMLVSAKGPPIGPPAKGHTKGAMGLAEHLYLYEKNPVEEHAWPIVEDGAWGKMTALRFYKMFFVFNGHQLVEGTGYTLISYKEPDPAGSWPATGCVILGTGTADTDGNVHIMGLMPDLVINDYTDGTPTSDEYKGQIGAKIWLVLTSDMEGPDISGWNPAAYLFEGKLLT